MSISSTEEGECQYLLLRKGNVDIFARMAPQQLEPEL